ncbi:MAG: glutamate--tRNA ligase [Pelagibacteraceae bacterium]|nr:glutamate--tRNA ligase [Pelagibacteraceae bacterium]MCI5079149.1 glutamate--tRNA ligase [Pelagibacteraceae bacterium]
MVITRFAPSPTGELHIGGARTALFNYLYSKNQNGKFLLRIEDTDKERSKKIYEDQIINSLNWLGINFDDKAFYQSKNIQKHIDIAEKLYENNFAYKCYCTQDELDKKRETAKSNNINYLYDGTCRELKENRDLPYVIRLKVEKNKKITLYDGVQGNIEIDTNTIEDFILLRSDNTPTYNLSAAVDDNLMNITHVIRGDDHKINALKQILIFQYMKWKIPKYFHVPLIHSENGKKLSKRDNASTTEDYKKIGILPVALRNYLLRLGWSYKDKEIFSDEESIKYFNLKNIGKSPSKLDFERIKSLNEFYIKNLDEKILIENFILYTKFYKKNLDSNSIDIITKNINILKNKAKTLEDIYVNSSFIFDYQQIKNAVNSKNKTYLNQFLEEIKKLNSYDYEKISNISENIVKKNNIKFKDLGQPLRLILTGLTQAPSIKDIIKILGINEAVNRINYHIN